MESGGRQLARRAAAVLALTAGGALLVATAMGGLPRAPGRAIGGTPEIRPVTVTDVVLGVGSDETERTLAWYSDEPGTTCVEYSDGTDFGAGGSVVTAQAWGDAVPPGQFWFHATLTDLAPDTRYSYRFGDCGEAWSTAEEFSTQDGGPFSFLFLGDPQIEMSGSGWATTLERATVRFPDTDFLVTAGDHVDSMVNEDQTAQWDLLLRPAQLREYALAPTAVNHDGANGTGTQYAQHLARPNVGPSGETVAGSGDYWFTYDRVLFMVLNSNSLDITGHRRFMEDTLAANPAAAWTIVSFHHSPFSAASRSDDVTGIELRERLSPILSDLGVDLVLGGHDHAYSRSFLMDGAQPIPESDGATVTAEDGEVLYIAANSASGSKFYELGGEVPWAAVANQEHVPNYSRVTVDLGSIRVTTYRTTDGSVVDDVTLRQDRTPVR